MSENEDEIIHEDESKRENEDDTENKLERIPVILPEDSSYYFRDIEFFGVKPQKLLSSTDTEEEELYEEEKRLEEQRARDARKKKEEIKPIPRKTLEDPKCYEDHVDYADNIKLPKHVEIVTREYWGAAEPRSQDPVEGDPLDKVLLLYTGLAACYTKEECCRNVRGLQELYMTERKLADIPWNFLIGCDGRVYEGRGWGFHPKKVNSLYKFRIHEFKSYDIAYMGPYFKSRKDGVDPRSGWPKLSFLEPMYNAVKLLVRSGVKNNYVDDGFGLISQVGC